MRNMARKSSEYCSTYDSHYPLYPQSKTASTDNFLSKAYKHREKIGKLLKDDGVCTSCCKLAGGCRITDSFTKKGWMDLCAICGDWKGLSKVVEWDFDKAI